MDVQWEYQYPYILLNFDDGEIKDYMEDDRDVRSQGGVRVIDTASKFGDYSCYFDGSGDWIRMPRTQAMRDMLNLV